MVISIVLSALQIYMWLIFARAILSWFRIGADSPIAPLQGVIYHITEPVLGPVRRIVPQIGMFDISIIVVLIGISVLRSVIAGMA